MEKIIEALGGKKYNPLGEVEPDLSTFLKNVAYILIALVSIAFTAGNYLSVARELPARISATECRVDGLERKQAVSDVQLSNIAESLISIQTDVREIRTTQMHGAR